MSAGNGQWDEILRVLKRGPARQAVVYCPEVDLYFDYIDVTIYDSGVVHIETKDQEVTSHLNRCDIIWKAADQAPPAPIRVLKPTEVT